MKCQHCDSVINRIGCEGENCNWWHFILHCDNCNKHSVLELSQGTKAYIQIKKAPFTKDTVYKEDICQLCGAGGCVN
jgi:hypothetical protein